MLKNQIGLQSVSGLLILLLLLFLPPTSSWAADGDLKWAFSTGSYSYVRSSPAIGSDGTIYVGADGRNLYAINPDGSQKWAFLTSESVYSSPALGLDGTIYVGVNDRNLYAINPDGSQKWAFPTGFLMYSTPALGLDGTIYVGAWYHLYAINPDGSQKWAFFTGNVVYSSPALGLDGTIYVGSRGPDLYAISPDGTQKWTFHTGGSVNSSPAIGSDGTIYVGSGDGSLYAIEGSSGGLADTPWPMFHHDLKHTGRAAASIELNYKLPYPAGDIYYVWRGNNTHTGYPKAQYAWDFSGVNIGDPVVAARAGTVFRVVERFPDDGYVTPDGGGKDPNTANYVVIKHDDDTPRTYALYLHLQQNSVPVEEGYPVWQGQHIGNIGLSGRTSGPHLHFQVQNSGESWWEQSIQIGFSDPDVARDQGIPQTGEWYTSSNAFITAQAIDDLATVVVDMNLQKGLDNSFDAKLEAVSDSLTAANAGLRNDAINKLRAFINAVEAQRGNKLTEEQADELVNYARSIISTLTNGVAAPAFMVDTTIEPPEPTLEQNYPNPFNPDTWIPYQLSEGIDVNIRIYEATGKCIRVLNLGHKPAGFYTDKSKAAYWNGKNEAGEQVSSGVYFYTIQAGDFTATKKMVVAK